MKNEDVLKLTTIDKIRLAKPFSVSIGSCQYITNSYQQKQIYVHKKLMKEDSLQMHTSTEHETEMLPTTTSEDDGSNRSNTSQSESESCKIIFLEHAKTK